MKYAILFGILSLCLLILGSLAPAERWSMFWAALSFGLTALGYAKLGPKIFGKRPSGTLFFPLKFINLPYLLYTWVIWHLWRWLSKEPAFNEVNDQLVIGRRLLPSELKGEFDHYIDLTAEFDEPKSIRSMPGYLSVPILDATTPDPDKLKEIISTVAEGRSYIHCAQGHGRTGLFALALLIHRGTVNSVEEGIRVLQAARPALKLNCEQLEFAKVHLQSVGDRVLEPS